MIDVTQDAIQVLLDHPKGQGMIVSCYTDTSMTDGVSAPRVRRPTGSGNFSFDKVDGWLPRLHKGRVDTALALNSG